MPMPGRGERIRHAIHGHGRIISITRRDAKDVVVVSFETAGVGIRDFQWDLAHHLFKPAPPIR